MRDPHASDLLKFDGLIVVRPVSDGQDTAVHNARNSESYCSGQSRDFDLTQFRYAHENEPGEKASADIYDLLHTDGSVGGFRFAYQHVAEVYQRDDYEYRSQMRIKMLMPLIDILRGKCK